MLVRLVVLAALLAPTTSEAGQAQVPNLVEVGKIGNQPTARWTVPEGVHATEMCFARVSDGVRPAETRCYASIYPTYFAPTTERLAAGTYDAYVLSSHGRSNVRRLVIAAFGPVIRGVSGLAAERKYRRAGLRLGMCEMPDGYSVPIEPVRLVIAQTRFRSGKLAAGRTTKTDLDFATNPDIWESWGGGCGELHLTWDVPTALANAGDRYRVAIRLITQDGAASRKVVRQIQW